MTDEQIRDLAPAFSSYLLPYRSFCNQQRTSRHLESYCRALLSEASRKTVEPNALLFGGAVAMLAAFGMGRKYFARKASKPLAA